MLVILIGKRLTISEFEQQNEFCFLDGRGLSLFDANYRNEPVSTEIKEQQLKDSIHLRLSFHMQIITVQ